MQINFTHYNRKSPANVIHATVSDQLSRRGSIISVHNWIMPFFVHFLFELEILSAPIKILHLKHSIRAQTLINMYVAKNN